MHVIHIDCGIFSVVLICKRLPGPKLKFLYTSSDTSKFPWTIERTSLAGVAHLCDACMHACGEYMSDACMHDEHMDSL